MKYWLQNCLDNHPECRDTECRSHSICGTSPTPNLPARVIEVGSDSSRPRLICGAGLRSPYAALSHCWGKCVRTTTTLTTVSHMMQGLPLEEFSPTFRDAINVCRRLGIPYLWIDSLCIVQDYPDDWTRESSNMADIYKNSILMLAAARSRDSQHSFLQARPSLPAGCELDESLGGLFIRPKVKWWTAGVELTLYNSRAWCFQEQQLASRVLYFCEDELVWYRMHFWQREASSGSISSAFCKMEAWAFRKSLCQGHELVQYSQDVHREDNDILERQTAGTLWSGS